MANLSSRSSAWPPGEGLEITKARIRRRIMLIRLKRRKLLAGRQITVLEGVGISFLTLRGWLGEARNGVVWLGTLRRSLAVTSYRYLNHT